MEFPALEKLKALVFESDNRACFIERERILAKLEKEFDGYNEPDKYARIFSCLMSEVSTPINEYDYFGGRVTESLPDEGMNAPSTLLCALGHMSPDYGSLLKFGLAGILKKIKERASLNADTESDSFAQNAEIVVNAVKNYAKRYAESARQKGLFRMANALEKVPYEPAYDFYSALQSIWLMHMIASCYVGSRDYAFGRFDEYMLPYYEQALSDGASKAELCELLAGFLIKTNEICGRATYNFMQKPILSQASKQYVNIGGETPNEFSKLVLSAALLNNMAQPQITIMLKPEADAEFDEAVFEAQSKLTDKINVYNYNLIFNTLLNKGIEAEDAKEFTYSACCTFDLNYYSYRLEYFAPVLPIFLEILNGREYTDLETLTADLLLALGADIQNYISNTETSFYDKEFGRKAFVLDALLHTDTALECKYPNDIDSKYKIFNVFCPGIATLGDSLMILDKLVFKEKKYTYSEFLEILHKNFEGSEVLRQRILKFERFGNDTEADKYTVLAAKTFLDAIDALKLRDNYYVIGGFYSLERDNTLKIKATPDGRLDGEPFSENQSPTYGADKQGITALLKSLSKLPFDRTATGGLNLTFSQNVPSKILSALVRSYFALGGLHVGISVVNSKTLKAAMKNPEKYQSLTVRLYGFSEYFVSLPEWQQLAILKRTQY